MQFPNSTWFLISWAVFSFAAPAKGTLWRYFPPGQLVLTLLKCCHWFHPKCRTKEKQEEFPGQECNNLHTRSSHPCRIEISEAGENLLLGLVHTENLAHRTGMRCGFSPAQGYHKSLAKLLAWRSHSGHSKSVYLDRSCAGAAEDGTLLQAEGFQSPWTLCKSSIPESLFLSGLEPGPLAKQVLELEVS